MRWMKKLVNYYLVIKKQKMKKFWLIILWLCSLFFAGNFTLANDYEYTNLNISANILEDGSVDVTEKFTADFFVNKHGIIRSIPLNYSVDWTVFHIDISNIDVEWKTFVTQRTDEEIEIKIWDPDQTVIGEQIYPISYSTYGLIKNFSGMGYSELYWSLVWYNFDTNINKVKAVLFLPKTYTGFTASDFMITTDWKTKTAEEFEWRINRSYWNKIIITYDKWLPANRGITLAIKFPNGYFDFDHEKQKSLIWRAKYDYSDLGYIAPNTVSNIANENVESDSELQTPQPEASGRILIEPNPEWPEPKITISEHEEQKSASHHPYMTITSNNYVSTWPKTKPYWNSEYEYTNLNITANILEDGTMNVKEDFTADFHVSKHGIIRVIPLNYSVLGSKFHIDVSNIDVQWKNFTTSKSNWEIEIKIWDANRTLVWEQTYPISYSTYGLIRNFAWIGYSELYWNLVGHDFDTNINNVKAEIYLPKTYTWLKPEDFLITVDWNTTSIYDFQWLVDWEWWNKITITYDRWLSSYQGITLAVKFPSNYFTFDHDRQAKLIWNAKDGLLKQIWNLLSSGIEILMPIGMFALFIFAFIKKWIGAKDSIDRKSGKLKWDFAKQFPVIVQYEPPKWMNSAEAGLLLHRGAKPKDMLSLIYKRAADWLIKLSFETEEWWFFKSASDNVVITKLGNISPEAPAYEISLFESLVRSERNKISATTNLYSKLSLSSLEKYGEKKWWFKSNKALTLIPIIFIWMFFLAPILWAILPALFPILILGFFFFMVAMSWWSKFKETEEWARLIAHVLWYREFLAACDENKLRLFLQQDPLYFDKILPYAVAFGLDTELIKKIEPIMQEMNTKPSWYDWDLHSMYLINSTIRNSATHSVPPSSSYDSGGWFSSWSSFSWWFSSGGWGWWWGGRSW